MSRRRATPLPGIGAIAGRRRPDGSVYMGIVNSMPFARPKIDEVLAGVRFVLEKSYPPRGEA